MLQNEGLSPLKCMTFIIRSGGVWEATSFNLGDLNPVEGWCLNGASIVFPLHHDLIVLP